MKKIDYKKERKHLYNSSAKKISIVEVAQMNFLMIDGAGDPNTSSEFQQAVEALFGVSYTLKFMIKKGEPAVDYGVMPLEGLWWADDMSQFNVEAKDSWKWTLMIMQPEFITRAQIAEAMETVQNKKKLSVASMLRFESFEEGQAAQIMHIGPFSEEGPTVEKLHDFIEENSFKRCGKHHEIYLSDIRRANPEKWRTVIRQPVG
jgi:hypothetical protein